MFLLYLQIIIHICPTLVQGESIFYGRNILAEGAFLTCLIAWESPFDDLCGLRQTAIS